MTDTSHTSWIDHAGQRILYVDYRGQTTAEASIGILEEERAILLGSSGAVLVLADFEGATATPEYMSRLQEVGKSVRNEKVAKTAALGITGLKAVLLDSYMRLTGDTRVKAFDSRSDALEWLVS